MGASRHLGQFQHYYWLMYILAMAAVISLIYGSYRRISAWRMGTGRLRDRLDRPGYRIMFLLRNAFFHSRILKEPFPGVIHFTLFWGFAVFLLGTVSLMLQEYSGIPVYQGRYYLLLNLLMDVLAIAVLVGIVLMVLRRTLSGSGHLKTGSGDIISLCLIWIVLSTGLALEGVRLALEFDRWEKWQPGGYLISKWFSKVAPSALADLHSGLWILHLVVAMLLIGSIPYLKLFHIFAGPAGIFFGDPGAGVSLDPIDFEDDEIDDLGVGRIEQFHWKQLLDTDACMSCGRCQEKCPAWLAGKPLSPMGINLDLKTALRDFRTTSETTTGQVRISNRDSNSCKNNLVGEVVDEEAVWACTTCRSCEVHCPVVVEHLPRLVDLRRHQVMVEGSFPKEALTVFRGLEDNHNPWNLGVSNRFDWAMDLDVPQLKENEEVEYLLWIGCAAAYDQRNQKVIRSLVDILKKAQIDFGVLGTEEKCCGDPARRLGNEFLYDSLVRANVATLNRFKVQKIITACPHCFNTLNNEYRQFDGYYEVIHHSTFIHSLLGSNKIKLKIIEQDLASCKFSFHDPCYLGRYNDVYEAPRQLLLSAGLQNLTELERNRDRSFCCGAGGGRMWLEEEPGKALNRMRTKEMIEKDIEIVATACPYCLIMLTDGIKAENRNDIQILDIIEIVILADD